MNESTKKFALGFVLVTGFALAITVALNNPLVFNDSTTIENLASDPIELPSSVIELETGPVIGQPTEDCCDETE